MTEKRDAIVQVSVPFCVDDRALRREGMILGWDSARMARYADALVAEIEANGRVEAACQAAARVKIMRRIVETAVVETEEGATA